MATPAQIEPVEEPETDGIIGKRLRRKEKKPVDAIVEPVTPPAVEPTTLEPPKAIAQEAQAPEAVAPAPEDIRPDEATETVEGRLAALTKGGSAYLETAKQDAIQQANVRGLINTSIAAGAGTGAAIRAALPIAQQDAEIAASFTKNVQSAELNKQLASFENNLAMEKEEFVAGLKTKMQQVLDNDKYSQEMKTSYVNSISQITLDAQQQIVDIGTSDRSSSQQATAIGLVEQNRDASIKVYEDLLNGMEGWDWGTDFTPEKPISAWQRNMPKIFDPGSGTWVDNPNYVPPS